MKDYTPAQVAESMGVSRGKVLAWIHRGELEAFDVSEGSKPRFRISEKALAAFRQRRQVKLRRGRRRLVALALTLPDCHEGVAHRLRCIGAHGNVVAHIA